MSVDLIRTEGNLICNSYTCYRCIIENICVFWFFCGGGLGFF